MQTQCTLAKKQQKTKVQCSIPTKFLLMCGMTLNVFKKTWVKAQSHGRSADGAQTADLAILFLTQFRAVSAEDPRRLRPHVRRLRPHVPYQRSPCATCAPKSAKVPKILNMSKNRRPVRRSAPGSPFRVFRLPRPRPRSAPSAPCAPGLRGRGYAFSAFSAFRGIASRTCQI